MGTVRTEELEIKLELTHEELERVASHPALKDLAVGQPVTRRLRSIYFDTPDHRLRAAGISLRLRSDGNGWLQTVKAGGGVNNGLSNHTEVETSVAQPEPDVQAIGDRKLRRNIEKAVERSVLEPQFETVVTRTTRQLHSSTGDLELALDEGVVRAGTAEEPLCEAELELKAGSSECLLETAAKLFAKETVRLAQSSKAERGFTLALGKSDVAIEPRRSEPVELDADQSCGEAFGLIVRSAIVQIEANREALLQTDDAEAAHQLRIGLRRLRSALRALRPLNDTPVLHEFEAHARTLARTVGILRDADVLIEDIYAPVAGAMKDDPGLPRLREAVVAHRAHMRGEVRAALLGPQWSALQLYLALWPRTIAEIPAFAAPVAEVAIEALDKAWKRVARYGKRLDGLASEEKHEMRKALKMLRYKAEFFASLYPEKQTRPFLKRAKALQDIFGYINDVAAAQRLNALCHEGCADSREAQRAAGYILGWHTSEAAHRWAGVEAGWQQLRETARFWR